MVSLAVVQGNFPLPDGVRDLVSSGGKVTAPLITVWTVRLDFLDDKVLHVLDYAFKQNQILCWISSDGSSSSTYNL